MIKKIRYVLYLLFAFLLVYYPPLLHINTLHIVGVIGWIGILRNIRYIKGHIDISKYVSTIIVPFLLLIYLFFVCLINGNEAKQVYFLLYWLVDVFPATFLLIIYFSKSKFSAYDILTFVLNFSLVQAFFTILAYTNPGIQEYFVNKLVSYGYDDVFLMLSQFRLFGFSSNLTYAMPVLQGFLTSVALFLGLTYKSRYYFYIPILFFSGIVNARISIVITLVSMCMLLLFLNYKSKKTPFRIGSILFIIISTMFFLSRMDFSNSETWQWINTGIEELFNFFNGNTTGYFTYVNSHDKYILPVTLGSKIFGNGVRVMGGGTKYGVVSDIGYVNDIWLGGIVFCITIYLFFFFIIKKIRKFSVSNNLNKFLFYSILCILVISNIKGFIFNINDFTTTVFILSFSSIYLKEVNQDEIFK